MIEELRQNPKSSINEQIKKTLPHTWLNIQGSLFPWLTEELRALTKKVTGFGDHIRNTTHQRIYLFQLWFSWEFA
jgi:hypothetical protein